MPRETAGRASVSISPLPFLSYGGFNPANHNAHGPVWSVNFADTLFFLFENLTRDLSAVKHHEPCQMQA